MSWTGRPSSPPLALMSSRQIMSAASTCLPMGATAPVKAMLKPTLIGSAACAAVASATAPNTAAAAKNVRTRFIEILPSSCCSTSAAILDKAVAHLSKAFDLGLHHVAGFEECIRSLADAAARSADKHVAGLERQDVRGKLDLLFRRVDELRGIAVLLHLAIDGQADEAVHVVLDESRGNEERSRRREIVVALAAEPI